MSTKDKEQTYSLGHAYLELTRKCPVTQDVMHIEQRVRDKDYAEGASIEDMTDLATSIFLRETLKGTPLKSIMTDICLQISQVTWTNLKKNGAAT